MIRGALRAHPPTLGFVGAGPPTPPAPELGYSPGGQAVPGSDAAGGAQEPHPDAHPGKRGVGRSPFIPEWLLRRCVPDEIPAAGGAWGGAPQIRRVGGRAPKPPLLRDARRGLRQRHGAAPTPLRGGDPSCWTHRFRSGCSMRLAVRGCRWLHPRRWYPIDPNRGCVLPTAGRTMNPWRVGGKNRARRDAAETRRWGLWRCSLPMHPVPLCSTLTLAGRH